MSRVRAIRRTARRRGVRVYEQPIVVKPTGSDWLDKALYGDPSKPLPIGITKRYEVVKETATLEMPRALNVKYRVVGSAKSDPTIQIVEIVFDDKDGYAYCAKWLFSSEFLDDTYIDKQAAMQHLADVFLMDMKR